MNALPSGKWVLVVGMMVLFAMALACDLPGGTPPEAAKPQVIIVSPPSGSQAQVGEEVVIQSTATDEQGVIRIDLWVNGQLYRTDVSPTPQGQRSFSLLQPWIPVSVGTYAIEVKAYNAAGQMSDPAAITVYVEAAAPGPPPTEAPGAPTARVNTALNVRRGPGTQYPVMGQLAMGDQVEIVGKNAAGTWWQIIFPTGTSGRGWISAAYTMVSGDTSGVPVVEAGPPPATATSTSPPPEAPATATATSPPPPPGVEIDFRADSTDINAGDCTTLRWDVENATAVYLDDAPKTGHDHQDVCPGITTTYTLRVEHAGGTTEETVTINVTAAPPPAQPDLIITVLVVSPASPVIGQPATVQVMENNVGDGAAGHHKVQWWGHPATLGCEWEVDSLVAGGARPLTCTYAFGLLGGRPTRVTTDVDDEVDESDEANNDSTFNVNVLPP